MKSRVIKTVLCAACALAPLAAVPAGQALAQAVISPANDIALSIGRGQLVTVPGNMADIFVSNEAVADVQVKSQRQLYVFGKAGVSQAGRDTFIGPTACVVAENGDIIVADGHWPRPASAQQDGDRLVVLKPDGTFVRSVGSMGSGPLQFMGPHALAFDSKGRLFVADRSNNRVQILDKDLNFVDEWRHFGRPSGIWILRDDTLIVSDSESNRAIPGATDAADSSLPVRNPGWKNGIRIGSAKDGSLKYFIDGTQPEGLAADEMGNVFGGLTGGCDQSKSGGCLQKFVKK